jgi:hypothetical protein
VRTLGHFEPLHTCRLLRATRDFAERLESAAAAAFADNRAAARWLAEQSRNYFFRWMSGATSGGEGTAMQYQAGGNLRRLKRILEEAV